MAEKPVNEHLWAMVVNQAQQKYHPYPSPGASHWVHQRYIQLGGKFEKHDIHSKKRAEMKKKFEAKMREKLAHNDHDARDKKSEDKKKK